MCDEIDDASSRYGCEDDSILISIEKRRHAVSVTKVNYGNKVQRVATGRVVVLPRCNSTTVEVSLLNLISQKERTLCLDLGSSREGVRTETFCLGNMIEKASRVECLVSALDLARKESHSLIEKKHSIEKNLSETLQAKVEKTRIYLAECEERCETEYNLQRQDHFNQVQILFKAKEQRQVLERAIARYEDQRQQLDSELIELRAQQRALINSIRAQRQQDDKQPTDISLKDLRSRLDALLRVHYRKLHAERQKACTVQAQPPLPPRQQDIDSAMKRTKGVQPSRPALHLLDQNSPAF